MKSSITSNVDSKLTPEQRRQAEVDARNDALIQEKVERAKRDGPVPELLNHEQQVTTTFDRLAEQKAFKASTKRSLIPIAVRVGPQYPGGFHYILSDADMDAVEAGFYCPRCLCRHEEVWQPACSTCGADRDVVTKFM